MKNIFTICFCFIALMGCKNGNSKQNTTKLELNTLKSKVAKVTIKNTEGKYQLLVNNEPFYIFGITNPQYVFGLTNPIMFSE